MVRLENLGSPLNCSSQGSKMANFPLPLSYLQGISSQEHSSARQGLGSLLPTTQVFISLMRQMLEVEALISNPANCRTGLVIQFYSIQMCLSIGRERGETNQCSRSSGLDAKT